MSSFGGRSPDLSELGDYDAILQRIGDVQLRPDVRNYFRIIYYIQQIRNSRWVMFCLFLTLCIEFGIQAIWKDHQTQAFVAFGIGMVIFTLMYVIESIILVYGGDPKALFETRDEEMAVVRQIGDLVMGHPHMRSVFEPSDSKHVEGSTTKQAELLGNVFTFPESTKSATAPVTVSSGALLSGHRALGVTPMASINTASPSSPLSSLQHDAVQQMRASVRSPSLYASGSRWKER